MKKLISLFIIVALLVSFAACDLAPAATTTEASTTGTTQTTQTTETTQSTQTTQTAQTTAPTPVAPTKIEAAELVEKALDAFWAANSFEAKTTADLTMSYSGVSYTQHITEEIFAYGLGTSPVWRTFSTSVEMDMTEVSEVYYQGGNYYVSKYGFYAKVAETEESTEDYGYQEGLEIFMQKIPAKKYSTAGKGGYITSVELLDNGSLKVQADTAKQTVMFPDIEEAMTESFTSSEDGITTTVGAPKESVCIIIDKSGNIKQYDSTIVIDVTISADGYSQTIKVTMEVSTEVDKLNKAVTVEKPEKPLDEFTAVEAGKLAETFAKIAYDEFAAEKDIEAELYTYIEMDTGVLTTEFELVGKIYGKDYNGETPIIRSIGEMTMGNISQTVDIYYKDGFYYVDNGTKAKLSEDEYNELYGNDESDESDEILMFLTSGSSEYTEIYTAPATGERYIYFAPDEQSFPLYFAKHISEMKELIAGEDEITASQTSLPEIVLTISKEGKLVSYSISYYLSVSMINNGKTLDIELYIYDSMESIKTENVTVPAPNLSSYTGSGETI